MRLFSLAAALWLIGCDQPTPASDVAVPGPGGAETGVTGLGGGSGTGPTGTGGTTSNGGGTTAPGDSCPPGVICVDSFPFQDVNSTVGGTSDLDAYSCAPGTDESGPEVVYRLDLPEAGFLAASLHDLPGGVDVDVHLLEQADPDSCIDRGHWDSGALLEPGTYWLVVDSWVDGGGVAQDGDYTLQLQLTTADAYVADGLQEHVLEAGLRAFDRAWRDDQTGHLEYAIMDYTLPSTEERMFVLDLRWGGLLFRELATHGIGSQDPNDLTMALAPSNVSGSNASSMGLVQAAEPYWGSNGYSLRLDGLEAGYNDNDRPRAIVIHGADYATQGFANANGYLGRSWGCPAVDPDVNAALIDTLADGGLFLKYWDDAGWLANSTYVAP